MFGPLLFGMISHQSGSQRLAIVSLLPFFLIGLGLMLSIDERRARKAAAQ
jgi:MFS-type transporter involved in bile tolerance (Atg22 family)